MNAKKSRFLRFFAKLKGLREIPEGPALHMGYICSKKYRMAAKMNSASTAITRLKLVSGNVHVVMKIEVDRDAPASQPPMIFFSSFLLDKFHILISNYFFRFLGRLLDFLSSSATRSVGIPLASSRVMVSSQPRTCSKCSCSDSNAC
jgi:hypothetical protein